MVDRQNEKSPRSWLAGVVAGIVGVISIAGLFISIVSFVENLHMGRALINFAWHELSQIQGWQDFVSAMAASLHFALELWRASWRDLFSLFPFHVPLWLHDPIAMMLFGISRVWMRAGKSAEMDDWRSRSGDSDMPLSRTVALYSGSRLSRRFFLATYSVTGFLLIPMSALLLIDRALFSSDGVSGTLLLLFLLLVAIFYAMARALTALARRMEQDSRDAFVNEISG